MRIAERALEIVNEAKVEKTVDEWKKDMEQYLKPLYNRYKDRGLTWFGPGGPNTGTYWNRFGDTSISWDTATPEDRARNWYKPTFSLSNEYRSGKPVWRLFYNTREGGKFLKVMAMSKTQQVADLVAKFLADVDADRLHNNNV